VGGAAGPDGKDHREGVAASRASLALAAQLHPAGGEAELLAVEPAGRLDISRPRTRASGATRAETGRAAVGIGVIDVRRGRIPDERFAVRATADGTTRSATVSLVPPRSAPGIECRLTRRETRAFASSGATGSAGGGDETAGPRPHRQRRRLGRGWLQRHRSDSQARLLAGENFAICKRCRAADRRRRRRTPS